MTEISIPRKWEYITAQLEERHAPTKVINAAAEVDNLLVQLGMGYHTLSWKYKYLYSLHNKDVRYYDLYYDVVMDTLSCTACEEVAPFCFLCRLGNSSGCTPRKKYADDYFKIVHHWVSDEIKREEQLS